MTNIAAVLWDLDGTIVDTEPLWFAAETDLAARHGKEWHLEDALELVGSDLLDSGSIIGRKLELSMSPAQIVDFLVTRLVDGLKDHLPWRPGAVELIRAIADEGIPQALVTMSYSDIAAPIAAKLPFAAVVTGDVVTRGKPFPDPYLLAAEMLGVDPTDCIAVEDSPTGATSANAAGCFVVAVPHMVDVPAADRRVALPSLEGVSVEQLESLHP